MTCAVCKRKFQEGSSVVPVMKYVTNPKRGDFVTHTALKYVHLHCVRNEDRM